MIDLIDSKSEVVFYTSMVPMDNYFFCGNAGGLVQDQPIIDLYYRTGTDFDQVYKVIGSSIKTINSLEKRKYASSILLSQNKLWGTGGNNQTDQILNSTEFISLDGKPVKGPNLPFPMNGHCMIQVNSNTVYIIGKKTLIVDLSNNFEIKEGPTLDPRWAVYELLCAKMYINGKTFIVVCGLPNGETEILDTSVPGQNWKNGMMFT